MSRRGGTGRNADDRRAAPVAGSAGSVGPPPYSPTDLGAALLTWHDASDGAARTVNIDGTGGAPIADQATGRLIDKSGNGVHGSAPALNARGILKTAVQNGLDVVRLDGVDDRYITPSFSSAETHYLVVARHAGALGGLFGRNLAGAYDWIYKPTGDTALANLGTPRGGSAAALNNAALWPAVSDFGLFRLSIVPGLVGVTNVTLWRDGVQYASSTVAIGSTPWNAPMAIGSTEVAGSANFGAIDIGEMHVLGAVSGAQLAQDIAYLKAKWGTP